MRRARHPPRGARESGLLAGERRQGNPADRQPGHYRTTPRRRSVETVVVADERADSEVDEAQRSLRLATDEILLAALGRTIARTIGDGVVAVDLAGHGRLVLKPDVDLHRTVGWFTTIYPVPLACTNSENPSAKEMLDGVHRTLDAVPHYGIGHGLLRYVYAPTARQLAAQSQPDIFFSYVGTIPELPSGEAAVQFDMDPAMPVRETLPGLGHPIELRAYRSSGLLHLDWWYDTRRVDPCHRGDAQRALPGRARRVDVRSDRRDRCGR